MFVHYPAGRSPAGPDVVWWQDPQGRLVERLMGEDTSEVRKARYILKQKVPSASWNEMFDFLGEFARGSENWDTHETEASPDEYIRHLMRAVPQEV